MSDTNWRCVLGDETGSKIEVYNMSDSTVALNSYGDFNINWIVGKLLFKPSRVMWAHRRGKIDWVETCYGEERNFTSKVSMPTYDEVWDAPASRTGRSCGYDNLFLVNHDLCEQIYLDACREIECKLFGDMAHPLPFLTKVWDHDQPELAKCIRIRVVGQWMWDLLQATTAPVPGYTTVYPVFGKDVFLESILRRGTHPFHHIGMVDAD